MEVAQIVVFHFGNFYFKLSKSGVTCVSRQNMIVIIIKLLNLHRKMHNVDRKVLGIGLLLNSDSRIKNWGTNSVNKLN